MQAGKAYIVIDTYNGLFDGVYFDIDIANMALAHMRAIVKKHDLRANLMIAQVSQEDIQEGISVLKFMPAAWARVFDGEKEAEILKDIEDDPTNIL